MSSTSTKQPTFQDLTSQLARADIEARVASQDAGAAREAKSQKAVETIAAAFREKVDIDFVRAELLAAGVLKGTVSKIATVLTGLNNKDLTLADVKSLNGSYNAVKAIWRMRETAAAGGSTTTADPADPSSTSAPVATAPVKAPTPEEALDIIIETIKKAKDPFAAASKWLTKVTNRITKLTSELADAEEESE